jgi:signal transduction histidine kinase
MRRPDRGPQVRSSVVASFTARPRLRGPELLRAVAEGTAGEVGEAFLRGLVRSVAEALAAKLVLVAEADDQSGVHVRVVAGWYDGAPIDEPFEYDTAGQPCALVPGQTLVAFPEGLVEQFPEDQGARDMGLESYLAVCLRDSQNAYLGHLAVLDERRMEAEPEDVAVLKIFAARAAAELERRNQAEALRASRARVIEAADAERRRVGRDLHDGAQQRLLAVSNLLRVARRKPETADTLLETAQQELSAAHAELRELARGLHPVALAERGLPAAIESLSSASALCVTLNVCPDRLPDDIAAACYFVVAESLTNASRYGQASEVSVTVAREDGGLRLEVADDGVGGADPTRGTGLLGLADRLEVLGGALEIDSPPGEGTRIRARLPLAV